jgi:hypothetical protein
MTGCGLAVVFMCGTHWIKIIWQNRPFLESLLLDDLLSGKVAAF